MSSSLFCFFVKQKTAYEMRISDWSSDVCSSDLLPLHRSAARVEPLVGAVLVLLAGEHLAAGVGGFLRRDAIFDGGAAHHLLHLLFHLVAAARHVGHVDVDQLIGALPLAGLELNLLDRKSTRLNSSH